MWKAYCRTAKELVDWECGSRSAQTFKKMFDWLDCLNVGVFFVDGWEVYVVLISSSRLV